MGFRRRLRLRSFVSSSGSKSQRMDPTLVAPTALREKKPCSHSPSKSHAHWNEGGYPIGIRVHAE
ncbi:Uncharacterized protein FKW44_005854 [Caligus rogercresseyi]|uniref:Uncharacterized protein n=1 Tax=Caligus rogercresseyi TaxID=217165 RepID=A0A7T8KCH3_CALRO|nr:Uncharacterized protein FKW44_005854 [Caligus rogercresseyi]